MAGMCHYRLKYTTNDQVHLSAPCYLGEHVLVTHLLVSSESSVSPMQITEEDFLPAFPAFHSRSTSAGKLPL